MTVDRTRPCCARCRARRRRSAARHRTAPRRDARRDQEARHLIVATEDDFRPFEFVKDGKPTGFDNELLEPVAQDAPFEIQQEIIPWTGLLAGVSTGKYDAAITAAMITKEREQFLDFTSPIAEATDYYVKRKADTRIKAIKDLSGKTVRRAGRQRPAGRVCPSSRRC